MNEEIVKESWKEIISSIGALNSFIMGMFVGTGIHYLSNGFLFEGVALFGIVWLGFKSVRIQYKLKELDKK